MIQNRHYISNWKIVRERSYNYKILLYKIANHHKMEEVFKYKLRIRFVKKNFLTYEILHLKIITVVKKEEHYTF